MSGNTLETLQMHSAFYVRPVEGCFLATFSRRVVYFTGVSQQTFAVWVNSLDR